MEFNDLELRWKFMVIIGLIFIVISVILAIFIVIMFKTDLIQYTNFGDKPDISEFDYLFDAVDTKEAEEEAEESEDFVIEDVETVETIEDVESAESAESVDK